MYGFVTIILTGVPVAWAIVDNEELTTLQEFFRCVKDAVPDLSVKTLMTDDGIKIIIISYFEMFI